MKRPQSRFLPLIMSLTLIFASVLAVPGSALAESAADRGDVNSDQEIDIQDAVMIIGSINGDRPLSDEESSRADMDGSGTVDIVDAVAVISYINGQPLDIPDRAGADIITSPRCKAAALYCVDDRTLLYADRVNDRISPASITKLMTASVALKYLDPETEITVGSELDFVKPYSSLADIERGQKMTLRDILYGLLLPSGNDAAYTIAVNTARAVSPDGSRLSDKEAVDYFSKLMNEEAAGLGMENSHFCNPEGWDDEYCYTTAADLIRLGWHAYSNPVIRQTAATPQKICTFITGETYEWWNTNYLIYPDNDYYCPEATGLKTGTTEWAGNALISTFEKDGKTYICVVNGCWYDYDRFELTLKILDACT